jgi:hypothetical protein
MMTRTIRVFALVALAAAGGCGDDDGFEPSAGDVAGVYEATVFTATTGLGTLDLLALGASAEVTLDVDGTTTGRLFIPGAGEGGEDVDEDLVGTWDLSGSTVTFNQTGDTFIRNVDFAASENQLTGEGVFDGQQLLLILTKAE